MRYKQNFPSDSSAVAPTRARMAESSLRLVALLSIISVLGLIVFFWLVVQSSIWARQAEEGSALVSAQALIRLSEQDVKANGNSVSNAVEQAMGLLTALDNEIPPGMLLDKNGKILMAASTDFRGIENAVASAIAAGSPVQGWFAIADAAGRKWRANIIASSMGWSWMPLIPCRNFDPFCSSAVRWIAAAMLMLLAITWLLLLRTLRHRHSIDIPRKTVEQGSKMTDGQEPDRENHMAIIGRLAHIFAHEFNNQLGVISNSAHLIERRAQDPRLTLPAQAMLRAVDSATLFTRRLQKLSAAPSSTCQSLDLAHWLPSLEASSSMVLGKRIALEVRPPQHSTKIHIPPDELELALTSILLWVRESFRNGAKAIVHVKRLDAGDKRQLHSENHVALCVNASAHADVPDDEHMPATWSPAAQCRPSELAMVYKLCAGAGGTAWAFCEPEKRISVCLIIPCPPSDR